MPDANVRVTVVSDYICPWCYVGMARIERLQRAFELDVTWHPFFLHPEIPEEGKDISARPGSHYDYLAQEAEAAGLPFRRPLRVPSSRKALAVAELARELGAFDTMHRALFEAYFGHGRDIGDPAVLREIAASVGIDATALDASLADGRYLALVDERTDDARRWGVTGTPTFIFDDGERRYPLVGAQDNAVFESVAQRMGAARRTETATA